MPASEWTTEDVRHRVRNWEASLVPVAFRAAAMLDAEEKFKAAMAAHDAEVRAKALEDAAEAMGFECFCCPASEVSPMPAPAWLRDRARAERGEA